MLTLLLERPTDDSVEVAIAFLKECGLKLTDVSPRGINGELALRRRLSTFSHLIPDGGLCLFGREQSWKTSADLLLGKSFFF